MNQTHKRIPTLTALLVITIAVVGSCVLARKGSAGGAASWPAFRPEPTERAEPALRAGMPALQSLAFEANEGQVDPSVKFLARTGKQQLLLTARSLTLRSLDGSVGIEFAGASDSAKTAGIDALPGQRNYLIGNDPKKW